MRSPEAKALLDNDDFKSKVLNKLTKEDLKSILVDSITRGGNRLITNNVTVEKGISEYEKNAEFNLSPKSCISIKTTNKQLLRFVPKNRELATVGAKDAEYIIRKIAVTAPKGVYVYLRTLKAEFNVFKDWGYLSAENPFEKVKLPKLQKDEMSILSAEQITILCNKLIMDENDLIADMVQFTIHTGVRGGELTNLRWDDVQFRAKCFRIGSKHFKTKSRRIRTIPLNDIAEQILKKHSEWQKNKFGNHKEFVFVQSNGKPHILDTISGIFKKAMRDLGLPEELHWHSLRHTAATFWVSKKVPIYTIQKLLGHKSVNTTQSYAQVDLQELRDAVERL